MTKQYDIVNIIGTNSFTYQLYTDMGVSVEGTSEVTSELDTESLKLLISFDLVRTSTADGFGLWLYSKTEPNYEPDYIYFSSSQSNSGNYWDWSFSVQNESFVFGDGLTGNEHSFEIKMDDSLFYVFMDDTLMGTTSTRGLVFSDFVFFSTPQLSSVTFENIVLGT
jgi:hypothetical protein